MKRIAVGQLLQETNTLNPLQTRRRHFEIYGLGQGEAVMGRYGDTEELSGFTALPWLLVWSAPMRDHLEAYIGRGGNAAFFSGNSVCWQVRSEEEGKALTCWKQMYSFDPAHAGGDHRRLSTLWSHHLVGRPENQLTGVGFLWGGYHLSHGQLLDGSGAFTVHRPEHWIFTGTGLKQDDAFGGEDSIVGYECDGCELRWEGSLPYPTNRDGTPEGFEVLGTAPAQWHPDDCEWYDQWEKGRKGQAVLGVYTRGGTVFTAGTTDWSHGLRGKDPVVERITRNVIGKLGDLDRGARLRTGEKAI